MNVLKKTAFIIVFILGILLSFSVMAQDSAFNTVKIHFDAGNIPTIVEETAVFELYDEDGATLLDTQEIKIVRKMRYFEIEFTVPRYSIGTKFMLRLKQGGNGIEFCGINGREHTLETFSYPDENGVLYYQTSFYMNYSPRWNKEAVIKVTGTDKTLYYHALTDSEVYVTTDLLDLLGIKCIKNFEDEKPSFTLTTYNNSHSATFYLNDIYAIIGSEALNLDSPTYEVEGYPFVPLSKVAEYFDCNYTVESEDEYSRVISLTPSVHSEGYDKAVYINSRNITSKTNYLIWISKKDYEVNVFTGSEKNWRFLKSLPCSIGASATPTIEGAFEYYQYQTRWLYDDYYCGPVMRFYNGYALHSVLIKYNGEFYDSRIGKKISHGCLRLLPEDIQWLAGIIPLKTKVFITA